MDNSRNRHIPRMRYGVVHLANLQQTIQGPAIMNAAIFFIAYMGVAGFMLGFAGGYVYRGTSNNKQSNVQKTGD